MKNENTKNEEGLPEIAQHLREKKPIVLVALSVMIIACFSIFHFSKAHKKEGTQSNEESYNLQQTAPVDNVKTQLVLTQSTPAANNTPPPLNPTLVQQQLDLIQAKKNELKQRVTAPLMLVNNAQPTKQDNNSSANVKKNDTNTQFMNQVSAQPVETSTATSIGSLNNIIAEGSLIHAILESATNSDLPGFIRAIVSEPCYSEDGTQILIPRGSRLIGQYKSGMLQGQSRIFLVWTRLITPNGFSIQLGSPGVDNLGAAGIGADETDRHFWERFGTASLLSIISAGAANAGVTPTDQNNSSAMYREAVANSFAQSATQSLQQDRKISPTLTTYQGKPIIVFVAIDLNFKNVMRQQFLKINIF